MINVGVLGSSGKMGEKVQKLIQTEYSNVSKVFSCSDQLNSNFEILSLSQVVIDFSLPEAAGAFIQYCLKNNRQLPLVIGSTGWSDLSLIEKYSKTAPVLMSSNFSIGVYITHYILKKSSSLLSQLNYKPSLIDIHHTHKRDAPSGTALSLKKTISIEIPNVEIPIESIREGEVVGDHSCVFESSGDTIIIRHNAKDRKIFAQGAIEVALWLSQEFKKNKITSGILNMDDFFNSKYSAFFKN